MARAVFHLTNGQQLVCEDVHDPESLATTMAASRVATFTIGNRTHIVLTENIIHIEHITDQESI